jgi:iron complex transport system substrate-binding protein
MGLTLLALVGCQQQSRGNQRQRGHQIKIEDDHGVTVALPRPARKIASLSPSNTEILHAVGCGGRIVLRDKRSDYPASVRSLPATNPFHLSPEHVAGFTPDLVLLSHADQGRVAAMRRIGLTVATFNPRGLEGVLANIRSIGRLCGAAKRAAALATKLHARVARVSAAVKGRKRPRVYIETDGTDPLKPWTAGKGSLVDRLVWLAGGSNIMATLARRFVQVNAEEVFSRDPDVVLLMGVGRRGESKIRARRGWSGLRAVREGKIVDHIHADLLSRPGPRIVDGLEGLAAALHPETVHP